MNTAEAAESTSILSAPEVANARALSASKTRPVTVTTEAIRQPFDKVRPIETRPAEGRDLLKP